MMKDRWTWVQHESSNERSAALRAIMNHYRGSEFPAVVEIWLKRNRTKGSHGKVRKFLATENGRMVYDIKIVKEEEHV